jgi:hypothetical protein
MPNIGQWASILQPAITATSGFFLAVVAFHLARRLEPFKAQVAFESKQKEITYSKLYDRRLEAIEGLHFRLTAIIDASASVVSPLQTIGQREGMDMQGNIRIDRFEKVQKVDEALMSLYSFHNQKSIYLPVALNKAIEGYRRHLLDMVREFYLFVENPGPDPRDTLETWNKASTRLDEARTMRAELDRLFRESMARAGMEL